MAQDHGVNDHKLEASLGMCWKQISEGKADHEVSYEASKITSFLGASMVCAFFDWILVQLACTDACRLLNSVQCGSE
jgi:hypothetical protein